VQCGDDQQNRRGAPRQAFVVNVSVNPHLVPGTCSVPLTRRCDWIECTGSRPRLRPGRLSGNA
jgi:hypothetical protein